MALCECCVCVFLCASSVSYLRSTFLVLLLIVVLPALVSHAIVCCPFPSRSQVCMDEAMAIVEDAWATLDPIVPDSFSKIMLRAFGWFVVERKT